MARREPAAPYLHHERVRRAASRRDDPRVPARDGYVRVSTVWAKHGLVYLGDREAENGPDSFSPDEAREHAAALLIAADEAEQQAAALAALCDQGHDWGPLRNGFDHTTIRHCHRARCNGVEQHPGWMPFAGRWHPGMVHPYIPQVDCTGPGCDRCEDEALGQAIHGIFRAAFNAYAGEAR